MRIENSFVPVKGVGEKTERKLWQSGITTWHEFDESVVGPTKAERITDFITTARDHLNEENSRFFGNTFPSECHWRLYENFSDDTFFLDIETTGLDKWNDDVTMVGLYRGDEMTTLVRGQNLSRRTLTEELQGAKLLITFNGEQFDLPILDRAFDIDIEIPHIDLMYPCRRLNLTGGLKLIERRVGIDRDRPNLSGEDAVRLWREYERGDDIALDNLITYNQEDVMNLESLMNVVTRRLHEEVFEAVQDSSDSS
jgi:uncharacterized protein YprB with RNaseH-like and TPR domain